MTINGIFSNWFKNNYDYRKGSRFTAALMQLIQRFILKSSNSINKIRLDSGFKAAVDFRPFR